MSLTPSFVKRSQDATGDEIKTFEDPLGKEIQASAIVDANGDQLGVVANPLSVSVSLLPLPDGATTEDTVWLLRRIVKLLESNAVIDSQQRQRVNIDFAYTLPRMTLLDTVAIVTSLTQLASVDARYLFIDTARNAYANGVRRMLNWS